MAKARAPLDRILRVRTLQLGLVRAEEVRAHERLASETALKDRITQLAANVAPAPERAGAFTLMAAAHYRDRLHQSADAAAAREHHAARRVEAATEATLAAKRDQTAVEKLIARREAAQAVKDMRALEEAPPARRVRHDPC
ncbi:MAG: hypothetical protein C0476_01735 [Sphingomonas sp.]|nr:hypothetical protein [Sphingomonas sp.]